MRTYLNVVKASSCSENALVSKHSLSGRLPLAYSSSGQWAENCCIFTGSSADLYAGARQKDRGGITEV